MSTDFRNPLERDLDKLKALLETATREEYKEVLEAASNFFLEADMVLERIGSTFEAAYYAFNYASNRIPPARPTQQQLLDESALDRIAAILPSGDWGNTDTLDEIASIVRNTGRPIGDIL